MTGGRGLSKTNLISSIAWSRVSGLAPLYKFEAAN